MPPLYVFLDLFVIEEIRLGSRFVRAGSCRSCNNDAIEIQILEDKFLYACIVDQKLRNCPKFYELFMFVLFLFFMLFCVCQETQSWNVLDGLNGSNLTPLLIIELP